MSGHCVRVAHAQGQSSAAQQHCTQWGKSDQSLTTTAAIVPLVTVAVIAVNCTITIVIDAVGAICLLPLTAAAAHGAFRVATTMS